MALRIDINQKSILPRSRISEREITRTAEKALRKINKKNVSLSLAYVRPNEMQQLNRIYRGDNKPTDVLAFSLAEKEYKIPQQGYWGEVIICPSIAEKQAPLFHNTKKNELRRLLIHGILHLDGYDHENKRDAKIMFGLTDRIIATLQ